MTSLDDFESGNLNAWVTYTEGNATVSASSSVIHGGTYSCKFDTSSTYDSGYNTASITKTLNFNTIYSISAWVYLVSAPVEFDTRIEIDYDESQSSLYYITPGEWTEIIINTTEILDEKDLTILVSVSDSAPEQIILYVDDITYVEGATKEICATIYIDDFDYGGDVPYITITTQPSDIVYPASTSTSEFEVVGASNTNVVILWNDSYEETYESLDVGTYQVVRDIEELGTYSYTITSNESFASSDSFTYSSNSILHNGDFDSAPPQGWTCSIEGNHFTGYDGGEISSSIVGTSGISGSSCAELTVINPATPSGKAEIYQYVNITCIESISFYYKAPIFNRVEPDTTVSIKASLGAYEYTVATLSTTGSHPITDWTLYTMDISMLPAGVYKFSIYALVTTDLGYYPGSKAQVYVDNVVLPLMTIRLCNVSFMGSVPTDNVYTDIGECVDSNGYEFDDGGHLRISSMLTDIGHKILLYTQPFISDGYICNIKTLYNYAHNRIRRIK